MFGVVGVVMLGVDLLGFVVSRFWMMRDVVKVVVDVECGGAGERGWFDSVSLCVVRWFSSDARSGRGVGWCTRRVRAVVLCASRSDAGSVGTGEFDCFGG